jgi:curli biogenesis system outer membrane secretion channel CsgG
MSRKLFVLLSVVALVMASLAMPAWADEATGGLRYTITVSKFENRAGWHGQWDIGDAWGAVLTDMLNQSGKFIVLGETDMRREAMNEQDFASSGRVAGGAKAPVTGQMTPAQLLVKGDITHVQGDTGGGGGGIRIKGFRIGGKSKTGEVNATIYIVDSTTGMVVASTNVVGVSKNKGLGVGYDTGSWGANFGGHKNDNVGLAVQDACAQAVEFLKGQLDSIPWTGSVALVRNGKVYINRGTREGVSPGMTFVVGKREVIRDPDTGEVLDEAVSEAARIQASQVKEKLTICDIVSGNAGAIQKGMAVHLP